MRKIAIIAACCFFGISCETESDAVRNTPQENLPDDPGLIANLLRTSQYPTTFGNVVDSTSCFAINLPATVIANGQTVILSSDSDYQQIRNIFAASSSDVDSVTIQFPIHVTYADYTTATFNSQSELAAAASSCLGSIELSCFSFNYPIGVKSYDTNNQLAETLALANKVALYQFLRQLGPSDVATLVYPITLNTPNGNVMSIASNIELASAISSFSDTCISALNPPPDPPSLSFDDIIVQGTWSVSYFYDDGDETSDYAPYTFSFNANGTSTITGGSSPSTGTWNSYEDSGDLTVEFGFADMALDDLQEDWTIIEFSANLIKMEHESGGGGGTDYLNLEKN